jgi:predicted MFS family arabinose efflux permease
VLQSVAFILIGLVSPVEQFPIFLALMVCAALGMSTYDTATDGLSIDTTPPEDRGLVQGLMVGGRALSGVIAALIIGQLSEAGRWPLVFSLIGGLGLVVLPLSLLVRESGGEVAGGAETQGRESPWRVFRDGAFLLFLVVGFIYPLALYGANGMVNAFLNEGLGVGLARVGIYTSVFGIGTVLGGIVGGPLIRRVGRRNSVLAALLITFIATLGLTAVPSPGLAWLVVFAFGIAFGYYETVYFAMGMDFADPRIAAFMFAFIMAVGNIGIGLGQPLAGALVDGLGFRWMFAVFAAVHLLTLPFVYALFRLGRAEQVSSP